MLNNRDDEKYDNEEESEYHFSDDEVSYDIEPETPPPKEDKPKRNPLSGLTQSRRMLISLIIFLVLVFVVYKMVAPTNTSDPSTDIAPPTTATQMPTSPPASASSALPAAPAVRSTPSAPVESTPAQATLPPPGSTVSETSQPTQPMMVPPAPPPRTVTTTTQVTNTSAPQTAQPTTNMPAVIPVQSPIPNYPQPASPPIAGSADASRLTAESERAMAQLHASYQEKMNEYTEQNQAMRTQLQTLSARVSTMEAQLNRLVQVLTQGQAAAAAKEEAVIRQPEPNINYNVQAIIPGRAWLRAVNGETLTVAEGDAIKGVGRVTRIDPYDGVVEINTGSKVISLTYGNGS